MSTKRQWVSTDVGLICSFQMLHTCLPVREALGREFKKEKVGGKGRIYQKAGSVLSRAACCRPAWWLLRCTADVCVFGMSVYVDRLAHV